MPWNAEAAEEPLSWQGGAARGLQRSVKAMQADLGLKPSRGRDQHRTPGSLPEALLPAPCRRGEQGRARWPCRAGRVLSVAALGKHLGVQTHTETFLWRVRWCESTARVYTLVGNTSRTASAPRGLLGLCVSPRAAESCGILLCWRFPGTFNVRRAL